MIPGWPYSFVAALELHELDGMLDAVRLGPFDDQTEVTARQVREVLRRLREAGQWAARSSIWTRHTHPLAAASTGTDTTRYGWAVADAWEAAHRQLQRRGGWADREGNCSALGLDAGAVDRIWQAYLRRSDVGHTLRLLKQTRGWTKPRIRDPHAADRQTWLTIVAYTQLRPERRLTPPVGTPSDHTRTVDPGPGLPRGFVICAGNCPFPPVRRTLLTGPTATSTRNKHIAAPPTGRQDLTPDANPKHPKEA